MSSPTSQTSPTERNMRDELLHVAVGILNQDGPDGLQTRKIASAAGTSTMAVYTYFGGMSGLIAAIAQEGLREFDAAMTMPATADPVADLMATGIAYRRYAIERPHMYRLMFGSTSAHGINAPAHDVLTLSLAEINDHYPSFAHVVRGVHRSMQAGRIARSSADDATVVAVAAQFWASVHGFVMLELAGYCGIKGSAVGPVLGALTTNLLIALGDSPEHAGASQQASIQR
jgi:AcrR family transcriptional regulator